MKREHLIFFVDSYFLLFGMDEILESIGLESGIDYIATGAGGADGIITGKVGKRLVDTPKLLVFMSTFHGSSRPAICLTEKIKEANPNAVVIFRSAQIGAAVDPVFDGSIKKTASAEELAELIRENLQLELTVSE